MAHARLAPSAAKRWINCPASVALIEKLPPQRAGYAAAEGTVAHALHEEYHTGKIDDLTLVAKIGTTVMQEGHEVEITEEMYESALEYHDAVNADIAALAATKGAAAVVHKTEAEVSAAESIDPECKGTADKIVYKKGKKLIVRDLKYGRNAVEVEDNEQMSVYAVATMESEAGWAFDEVELIIDQPRAKHEDGKERRWITTPAALKEFAAKAKAAALETRNPNAALKAGPWCQSSFCPVRAKCPAVHGQAQASAVVAFSDPVPTLLPEQTKSIEKRALAFKALRLPEVQLMSDSQLVDALRWKEAVGGFFTAVEEYAMQRHLEGKPIAGTKLVNGKSNRAWANPSEVAEKFGEKAWSVPVLLSPAKLEAVVGKKAGVDAMTYKPEPKKLLVLDSDPREAARVSAQEAFADTPTVTFGTPPVDEDAGLISQKMTRDAQEYPSEIETTCPECDILGVCSRHDVQPGAVSAEPKKREPIWPQ